MAEQEFTIKVTNDCHPTKAPVRFEMKVPMDATVKTLSDCLCEKTQYPRDAFIMKARFSHNIKSETEEDLSTELAAYFDMSKESGALLISRSPNLKDTKDQTVVAVYETESMGALVPQKTFIETDIRSHSPRNISEFPPLGVNTTTYSMPVTYNWNAKSDTGYCGLSNQGATCYLNSLLQTLFMTPEFRSALYNWPFEEFCTRSFEKKLRSRQEEKEKITETMKDNEEESKTEQIVEESRTEQTVEELYQRYKEDIEESCIPRQLQKLFLRLNTSDKRACETKNLTKSFGWKQDDAFTQHDVQELCRVLFDALDTVWKGTEQANIINDLYQGEMKDYVQCLSCGHESSRTDKYLDIPLVIKGFGEAKAAGSIEEALEKFIEPETLSNDNQYHCGKCNKKTDALKGLKFNKFPYLLSLQLKRFDFDFQSLRRIKLNDRVTFPEILDMNQFLSTGRSGLSVSKKRHNILQTRQLDKKNIDKGDANMEADYDPDGPNSSKDEADDETDTSDISSSEIAKQRREQVIKNALRNGPYVYELFSVLIHRGSALGGHYYAFIRSFNSGKWFEYNDSTVKEIHPEAYKETFGENEKKNSMAFFSSGTNAYMLMYRLYDPERNQAEATKDNIPESHKKLIEEEARIEEEKEQEKERQRSMVTFKFLYKDQTREIKFEKTQKFQEVKEAAAKALGLETLLPNNLRLREYSFYYSIPKEPISDEILPKYLSELWQYSNSSSHHIYVETKLPSEEFIKYNKNDVVLRASYYDSTNQKWSPIDLIWISPKAKIRDLKNLLAQRYSIPVENQVLVKEDMYGRGKILRHDNLEVSRDINEYTCKIFVEPNSGDDKEPLSFEEIERIKNSIEISFTNADEKEYKHKLTIDKRITVLDLKLIIEKTINLSIDEFRVYKVVGDSYKTELRSEEVKLADTHFYSSIKLLVERGKPLRQGEIICKWILYDIYKETKDELFDLALPGKLTMKEIKFELIKHWKEIHTNEQTKKKDIILPDDPSRLRIRNVNNIRMATIHMDDKTLKDVAGRYIGITPELFIQVLPEGKTETKTSDDIVVIILRQFYPDRYELGTVWEFDANKDEKLGEFRDRISAITGIPPHSLALAMAEYYDIQKILRVPQLKWHPKSEEDSEGPNGKKARYSYQDVTYDTNRFVRSLNLSEGDMLLYRDLSVPLKKLTVEEEKKIKEEEEKKRHTKMRLQMVSGRKEERLDIKIADVSLSDEPSLKTKKKV